MKNFKNYNPVDKILTIYILIISFLILSFHKNLENWGIFILIHFGILLFIYILNIPALQKIKLFKIIDDFYIIPGFILLYDEIGYLCLMIIPEYLDNFLIQLDQLIFGFQPSVQFALPLPCW